MNSIKDASPCFWQPQIGTEEHRLVSAVLESNFLNDGQVTAEFERQLSVLLGVRHVVSVTSGTAAIYLALAALDIGPGDEVIVPDVTFIATANAVSMTGAKPVLVDVEPRTLNIDAEAAARAITSRTKAIIPVHVSGRAADMFALLGIGEANGLSIVEDAAEAFTSKAAGRCLGTIGKAGCFSFSPNKTITTGQGGAVVTDDDAVCARLRELKDQGRPVRGTGGDDIHRSIGYNFKFTNLQAAVGLGQLSYLNARVERMTAIHRTYAQALDGAAGVGLLPFSIDSGEVPQWTDALVENRAGLCEYLAQRGILCRNFWHPLHTQAPYRQSDEGFPNSTALAQRALWLPSAFTLSDDDVVTVCRHIRVFYEGD
jgi:perosamine synthetase